MGPTLVEFLDLPQMTGARGIQVDREVNRVLVQKRVPGFLLRLSCPLPAVVTMEKGHPLRYPKYRARQRARTAAIHRLTLEALGLTDDHDGPSGSKTMVERFTPPKPTRRSAMASAGSSMSAAGRLQRIMSGGVADKKDSKIWECKDSASARRVAEHLVKEKVLVF